MREEIDRLAHSVQHLQTALATVTTGLQKKTTVAMQIEELSAKLDHVLADMAILEVTVTAVMVRLSVAERMQGIVPPEDKPPATVQESPKRIYLKR